MSKISHKKSISRKEFSHQLLKGWLACSFLLFADAHKLFSLKALSGKASSLEEIRHLSYLLAKGKISQIEWQNSLEKIFETIDLNGYMKHIDLDHILRRIPWQNKNFHIIPLGKSRHLHSGKKLTSQLFIMREGRSVVPHGHNYMTSGFLVLKGGFQGRHYERIQDEKKHMIIEPSIDKNFSVGEYSSISDEKNNVHWFKANSEYGVILNIHIKNLQTGPQKPGRVYVDPRGEKLSGSLIRAPRINRRQAYQLFG